MKQKTMAIVVAVATAALLLFAGCGEDTGTDETAVAPDDGMVAEQEEQAPEIEEAEPLEEAPNFTVPLIDGGEVQIDDYRGRILVLDFWATFCAACVKEFPDYQELYDSWDHDEVEYLGLSADGDIETARAFLEGHPDLTLPMGMASDELLDAYIPTRTLPSSRVIDSDGVVRYEFKGAGVEKVREAVRRLLEEEEAGGPDASTDDAAADEPAEAEAATD